MTARESISAAAGYQLSDFIAEASHRFDIPEHWIRAVMRLESGVDTRAVSRKGAIGLMQIMPATWKELRSHYALGTDPFDPHDNILAGTAYLRDMRDRYGVPGFLAAYNAGPARYNDHVTTGRPLPLETRAYVAKLAQLIGAGPAGGTMSGGRYAGSWRQGPLFVMQPNNTSNGLQLRAVEQPKRSPIWFSLGPAAFQARIADLFVRRSARLRSR